VLWTPGGVSQGSSYGRVRAAPEPRSPTLPDQEMELTTILECLDSCGRIRKAYWPAPRLSIGKTVFSSDYEDWEARLFRP
jgi:hypothetical protein